MASGPADFDPTQLMTRVDLPRLMVWYDGGWQDLIPAAQAALAGLEVPYLAPDGSRIGTARITGTDSRGPVVEITVDASEATASR